MQFKRSRILLTFVFILLAAAFCLSTHPAKAETFTSEEFTCGDYLYQLSDDGNAIILAYEPQEDYPSVIVVPEELDGHPVTAIGTIGYTMWPEYSTNATEEVILPDSIRSIGAYAFSDLTNLSKIRLPDGLEAMGQAVFADTKVQSITIPNSLTTASDASSPFIGATQLTTVIFGDGIETIPASILKGGSAINDPASKVYVSSVVFPESVRAIGEDAFENCLSLTELSLPPALEEIGNDAFRNTAIRQITLPKSLRNYSGAFSLAGNLEEIFFEEGTTSIPEGSLEYTINLKQVTIPASVNAIGEASFRGCSSLERVVFAEDSELNQIGESAFYHCTALSSIHLPDALETVSFAAFSGCTSLEEVRLPEHLSGIKAWAFRDCSALKSVSFPASTRWIAEDAFSDCTNLSEVTFTEGLEVIGTSAFNGTALKSVQLPATLISAAEAKERYHVGAAAFYQNTTIQTVSFAEGSLVVPESMFWASSLETLSLPDTIETIERNAFGACSALVDVVLPAQLVALGPESFYGTGLTTMTIPNLVTDIGSSAFSKCSALKTVSLPDGLQSIGSSAFFNCSSLQAISFSQMLKTIESEAFSGCTALESVSLPGSLQTVRAKAFANTGISEVTISCNLNTSEQAFVSCENLTTATFSTNVDHMSARYFSNCPALTRIVFLNKSTVDKLPYGTTLLIDENHSDDLTIYGYSGAWSEYYADKYHIPFVALDEGYTPETYTLSSVKNTADHILVTSDALLPHEDVPDGVLLLRKAADQPYDCLQDYPIDEFNGGFHYRDTDVEVGKTYTYALQAYRKTSDAKVVKGNIGKPSAIRRYEVVAPLTVSSEYYDHNRIPIVQTENAARLLLYFKNPLPATLYKDSENSTNDKLFTGTITLSLQDELIYCWDKTPEENNIIYEENAEASLYFLQLNLPGNAIKSGSIPSNRKLDFRVYNAFEDLICETQAKASFERLGFRNSTDDIGFHIPEETAIALFGEKQGTKLYTKFNGAIANNGLCFGMSLITDLFQAGRLRTDQSLQAASGNISILDLARPDAIFTYHNGKTTDLEGLIKYAHLFQFISDILAERDRNNYDFDGLMEAIDAYKRGDTSLMPMIWMESGKHAHSYHCLLAFDYEKNADDDRLTLYTYEPGSPYAFQSNIVLEHYSSNPEWTPQPISSYEGSKAEGSRFSWFYPDWDILSGEYLNRKMLIEVTYDNKASERLGRLFGSSSSAASGSVSLIDSYPDSDDDSGTIMAWIDASGTVDFSSVLAGASGTSASDKVLSLTGSDSSYEISGADTLQVTFAEASGENDGSTTVTDMQFNSGSEQSPVILTYSCGEGENLVTVEAQLTGNSSGTPEDSADIIFSANGTAVTLSNAEGTIQITSADGKTCTQALSPEQSNEINLTEALENAGTETGGDGTGGSGGTGEDTPENSDDSGNTTPGGNSGTSSDSSSGKNNTDSKGASRTDKPAVTPEKSAVKANNPLKVKAKNVSVKASRLLKKKQSIKKTKAFKISGAAGKVTFKKVSGNKKITVSKAGKITIKKGLKKGTWRIKVKVTAAGNAKYKAASKAVTVKIKVK